jgi:hypothetical protein
MFNGIFSQFVTQTVENPPKLWADQTEKPNSNRKIRPLWGDFVEKLTENAVKHLNLAIFYN